MKKLLLILLIGITYTFANVGKITAVKGEVYIIRDTKQIVATSGSILELKDQVQTKQKAKALVLFNDNTSITVGNNSLLSVNEFVMDLKTPSKSKTNFGFGKGVFRTITGKIGKINPKGFKIKTKSASIGIRGTIFSVKITPKNLIMDVQSGATWILPNTQKTPIDVPEGSVLVFDDETGSLEVMPKETFEKKKKEEKKKDNSKGDKQDDTPINTDEPNTQDDNSLTDNDVDTTEIVNKVIDVINETTEKVDDADDDSSDNTTDDTTDDTDIDVITNSPIGDLDHLLDELTKESICTEALGCDHYAYVSYGYLLDDSATEIGTYVSGTTTPSSIISSYFTNPPQTGNYTGKVAAIIDGSTISDGTIDLNMNFSTKKLYGGN